MTETSDDRPRPGPRPRPGAPARPTPRPRVAGSRRERDEAEPASGRTSRPTPGPGQAVGDEPTPSPGPSGPGASTRAHRTRSSAASPTAAGSTTRVRRAGATAGAAAGRLSALVLVLALLCVLAAATAGLLVWQRLHPSHVDPSVFAAARNGIEALYAYDYRDSEGSVQGKLDVLTGDLREQYEEDLTQGGIIETYEQVSATTRYEVLDVGLQQVNDAQDTATMVVFGEYVVESVNSGSQPAPEGSECRVTPGGAQSCTQTVQVRVTKVDGDWKISELTLLTTS
jgi:co-chaperonin GroES (HSP10)